MGRKPTLILPKVRWRHGAQRGEREGKDGGMKSGGVQPCRERSEGQD
jgi:hypothetical protein